MARPSRPEPKVFMSDEMVARGLDWYRATYFSHVSSERMLGEKSTSYLEDVEAAARAASMLGTAEIVVQLRDPIARAVSNWRFSSVHGLETRPLRQALEENLRGPQEWDRAITSVSPYAYLERGRYVDYLKSWFSSFPDTVHVRLLEDVTGHRVTARDLYAALGVDAGFEPPGEGQPVNESSGTAQALDDTLLRRLRAYFRASDALLSQRLGRALPWSAI